MNTPAPKLKRIRFATLAAPDIEQAATWYSQHLDYTVAERGVIAADLAESWGAPQSAQRPYLLLASQGSPDVFIRVIATDWPAGYTPLTTFGWNAIELICDDLDAVDARMKASPFAIIGVPAFLGPTTLKAMQVQGPVGDVLYLTTETGDRERSTLPIPACPIDRPFVCVVAGPDAAAIRDFYADVFGMQKTPLFDMTIPMLSAPMGLPDTTAFPITMVRGAQRGNGIEIDGYPAVCGPRPRLPGQLPPGMAMASFSVANLDELNLQFIAPPRPLYNGQRAATLVGPAGELLELIEEPGA